MRPDVIRLTLSDAESLRAYNLSGTALTMRSASAPFATVAVSLDDSSGPWLTMRQGDRVPVAFDRLYLKWDAQPGQWVELVEGEGWAGDPIPDYVQRHAIHARRAKHDDQGGSVTDFPMTGNNTPMNFVDQPIILWPGWSVKWQASGGITSTLLVFVDEY